MNKGLLITFEGPDGSGKTTQISMLKEYLNNKGFEVIYTREPGGTKISEKIRDIILDNKNSEMSPMCEALLYASARAQLVQEVIKPAIESGKIVICDRFVESSIVYQGIGRNLGEDRIRSINEAATDGLKADITFMLTIPFEEGLRRKAKQKSFDRLENSGSEFHRKVYEGYMNLAKSADYIKVVDANKPIEEVHKDILQLIENLL
ncbi:dTMP kinase [Clostridium sp. SYSU_GA19001]|uniref:dTMP kinase n=1 Tax=Clostridium caldaquaticum TaxID=2940653 RepID=UPI00207794B8|nr:dTMP kinase [Clostridium caldaquaticum]MCM8709656.1 dTMP kinase [Clostridium caldaquaticum]